MAKTKTLKKVAPKKVVKTQEIELVSTPASPTIFDTIAPQAPLAKRCETRAMAIVAAMTEIAQRLATYQDPRSVKDLDSFVEVNLRAALESLGQIVSTLNAPRSPFGADLAKQKAEWVVNRQAEADRIRYISNGRKK